MNHVLTKKIAKTALSGKNYWKLLLCYFLIMTLPTILLNRSTAITSFMVYLGTFVTFAYTKVLFEKKSLSNIPTTTNNIFKFVLLSIVHSLIIGIPIIVLIVLSIIIILPLMASDFLIIVPLILIFLGIFLVIYEFLVIPMNNIAVKLMHEPKAKFGECFKYGWKSTFSNFGYYSKLIFSLGLYLLAIIFTFGFALIFIQPSIIAIRYQAALEIYNKTNSNSAQNIDDTLNLDKIDVY
ncbi:MAG: hypothetical protein ACRC41_03080 [Sarcina sp.]